MQVTVHDRFTADQGGRSGLVCVVDDRTLAFRNYDGNGVFLSMGNLAATHCVGLLFIDFAGQDRIHVQGSATLAFDDR